MDEKLLFKGILIVSDMDKTLLTEDFEVPQRNIDAIEKFISKGGHFSLATGRSAESAEKYLKKVPINSPCILTNGASIFDFRIHEILWNAELSDSIKTLLPNILERFPDIGMEIYKDEQIYIINKSRRTEQHIINEGIKFTECSIDDVTGSWQKVLFADENSKLLKVQDYIKELG
ncbi:MAG TPA: HAD-IIB family hydrolase, partial [Ruminiclostridium sp.]|nr:HAD-IIB family hydrolase [Ruminiclostridium sp.]